MDATYTAVLRLWEQNPSMRDIARRLNISHGKVQKILVPPVLWRRTNPNCMSRVKQSPRLPKFWANPKRPCSAASPTRKVCTAQSTQQ